MNSTLKNHPIWHNLAQTLGQLNPDQIAIQHLHECNDQINGYWDDDDFYEKVTFTCKIYPKLISSSLGVSPEAQENTHWLQLKFALVVDPPDAIERVQQEGKEILGELFLILGEDLEILDENWLINIHSPYVLAK